MGKLLVFNSISLDGYFVDLNGDMGFANNSTPDAEWEAFVNGNASGSGGTPPSPPRAIRWWQNG
jgi:hypothetical protein